METQNHPSFSTNFTQLVQQLLTYLEQEQLSDDVKYVIQRVLNQVKDSNLTLEEMKQHYETLEKELTADPPFSSEPQKIEDLKPDLSQYFVLICRCIEIEGLCIFIGKPSNYAADILNKWGIERPFTQESSRRKNVNLYIDGLEEYKKRSSDITKPYYQYLVGKLQSLT